MSKGSTAKKAEFLGMPLGTASGRLRKSIMFSMAVRLGEDNCFRCGKKIVDVNELSIEHKQPWEGVSVDLFFDINNISFSHLVCNIRGQRHCQRPALQNDPEDQAWCFACKDFHDRKCFGIGKRNGLSKMCKNAQSIKNKTRPTTRIGRSRFGLLAQSGERLFCTQEAIGS